jgi:hypothetical protein
MKNARGRRPKADVAMLEPITIRLPALMVRQLEAIQAKRLDAPDKSSLIRELLAKAIKAEAK